MPSFLGAQVEQESCISLKHPKCWNPRAELKTSREWGRGLGQVTTAYNPDGSIRFDKQSELRAAHPGLKDWTIERWAEPRFQLLAMVEMDRGIHNRIPGAASEQDRLAMTLAAYNGGEGGVRQDRLLCRNTPGCEPGRWFGHVEHTSAKRRQPFPDYKSSPFKINREYVVNVLHVRRQKYEPFFVSQHAAPRR